MVYIGKDLWKEGLGNYLKSENPWEHDFKDEFTIQDTEQSILSKMIWESLFNVYFDDKIEMTISKETYVECSLKNSDDRVGFRVYFDVMNNNKQIKNILYHRVGNYTVYPQMEGKSLQIIHKWCDEKWDDFLGWLRENWEKETVTYKTKKENTLSYVQSKSFRDKWKNGLVFKEYMILTCQQMYYKEIYDTIYEKIKGKGIEIEKLSDEEKGVTSVNELKDTEILDDVNAWNEEIRKEEFEGKLITINNCPETIEFLIALRGRIMIALIRNHEKNIEERSVQDDTNTIRSVPALV